MPSTVGARVDAFPDRAGRVAAFESDRRDELVRERVEQDVGEPEELALALVVVLLPAVEAGQELLAATLDCGLFQPGVDRLALELDEDPLAPVLDGREPGDVAGQWGSGDADHPVRLRRRVIDDSKRVNPTVAITSRSRWTRTTRSTAAIQG